MTDSPNTVRSDSGLKALLRANEIDTRMIAMVVVLIAIWLGLHLLTGGRTIAPMDPTYQLLGGGIHGSIGATWSWIFGAVAIAVVTFLTWQHRHSRLKHGFPTKPIAMELALLAIWTALIIGFVMVMNSYYKPRTEIPRGIPVPVLILIGVVLVMSLLCRVTSFGRYVFAMGGNPRAAELSGINVKRTTLLKHTP